MNQTNPIPQPLFDTLENINTIPEALTLYLNSLSVPDVAKEYHLCTEFLKSYANSKIPSLPIDAK